MTPIRIDRPSDVMEYADRKRKLGLKPTYVVLGSGDPTDKAHMTEALRNNGHTAVEISPLINAFVRYEVLANCNFIIEYVDTVAVFLGKPFSYEWLE